MGTRPLGIGLALILCAITTWSKPASAPTQPDSLELARACATVRTDARWPRTARFISAQRTEPSKTAVRDPERITITGFDDATSRTFEAIVTVAERTRIDTIREVSGVQPLITGRDFALVDSIVHADPQWLDAIRRRGFTDPTHLVVDGWASGIPLDSSRTRMARGVTWYVPDSINRYDRVVEGLVVDVDLTARRVVRVTDLGARPLPAPVPTIDSLQRESTREPLQPRRPQFDTFVLRDSSNRITWQNWTFAIMFHPRDGVVLYDVQYRTDVAWTSVAWRIGLSEMFVPYSDPAATWVWRNAFDVGEYGVGLSSGPLVKGADIPEESATMPVAVVRYDGTVKVIPDVIGIYERDGGMLWRHRDPVSDKVIARRGRELVVTHTTTVGNYDYAVSYVFCMDGTMKVETRLSGIMLTKAVADTTGMIVAPNVAAPYHQHFFSFRIDMDVAGRTNTVHELDAWAPPTGSTENPRGNAWMIDDAEFRFEREARARVDMSRARTWLVTSSDEARNGLGQPRGYMLMPGGNAVPYLDSMALPRQRARFIDHHLWVTSYKPDELYAAGAYPNQSRGDDGLPRYCADDESVRKTDVVLWYTLGITHVTRPEDWFIMPAHTAGFSLVPMGFNERNPAQDLPGEDYK